MARIIDEPSRTFSEFRFHPRNTGMEQRIENITLSAPLVKYKDKPKMVLNIPFTSAVMQSVSGPDLGISLAREGGLSFIFCSQPIEHEAEMIREVKSFKAGFVKSDSNLSLDNTLKDVRELTERTGHSTIPITSDGKNDSELLGIVTDMDHWPDDPDDLYVKDIMTPISRLVYAEEGISLREANAILKKSKKSALPIVKDNRLKYLVFKKDYMTHFNNPLEVLDEKKRLLIGAGVNTRDYKERVPVLVKAGADVLVIDTSDGHSDFVKDTIQWVKKNYNIPIGAGNVVTGQGFIDLVKYGADFIKVGIGGGSICITQEQKGIGRGQATAVKQVAMARDKYFKDTGIYVPICSDGGLVYEAHILMALAFGADFVMMGRYFARFHESPTPIREVDGKQYKPYWGEGSDRAKNWQRYFTGGKNQLGFEEGVEGSVPYAGYLKDNVQRTIHLLKSTMSNLGCKDINDLHENAIIERSSQASIKEGKAHDVDVSKG